MEKIKLIISDLDGTLLQSDGKVGQRTIDAITKAKEKGLLFGIATGRTLEGIEKCTENWGIEHLCDVYVGAQGSHIIDKASGLEKRIDELSGNDCMEIFNHFKDLDVNFTVFADGNSYSFRDDTDSRYLAKATGYNAMVLKPEILFQNPQIKIVITTKTKEYMKEVIEHSKSLKNGNYKAVSSWSTYLEYVPVDVSKSNGIREILKIHDLSMENILAFGDAENDLEMIQDCGVGVCMENGFTTIKEIADYTTDSNNNDGIAKFIEKYIL